MKAILLRSLVINAMLILIVTFSNRVNAQGWDRMKNNDDRYYAHFLKKEGKLIHFEYRLFSDYANNKLMDSGDAIANCAANTMEAYGPLHWPQDQRKKHMWKFGAYPLTGLDSTIGTFFKYACEHYRTR